MKRQGSVWKNLDWVSVVLYGLIVLYGWITVYAVQYQPGESHLIDFGAIHGRQLIWIIVSIVAASAILIIDSSFFTGFAWSFYGFVLILLLLVMFFAREVNGARSWLELGPVKIQPAEFAKYATALALAKFLSGQKTDMRKLTHRVLSVVIPLIPLGLIILQGDMGSALVFTSFIIVLYREGFPVGLVVAGLYLIFLFVITLVLPQGVLLPVLAAIALIMAGTAMQRDFRKTRPQAVNYYLYLVISCGVFLILVLVQIPPAISLAVAAVLFGGAFLWSRYFKKSRSRILFPITALYLSVLFSAFAVNYTFNEVLEEHQRTRILTLVGQSDDKDANYNVQQSKMTIASGGLAGKGYLRGTLTEYGHVPEQQTDFIFCTIGEEFGFAGSAALLLLYLALLMRIVYIAERQRSRFSRVYAYGVAGVLFIQISINIGMTIGLAPVIGIPLPFISYGGSSVLAFTMLIFTMLRLDADRLLILR